MPIKKGDLIYIDYIGIVKESGEIFDTTIEEEAKKAGIYNEKQRYKPVLVAVGKSWVVEGLDEALVGREENQYFEVEVPPEKGFGNRDVNKIVIYTRRKLLEAGIRGELRPGAVVTINGAPAIVRAGSGGRYLLDFNPPLAGKTLIYKVWIRSICKTIDEKIQAIIRRRSEKLAENAKCKVDLEKKSLEIHITGETALEPEIQMAKKSIIEDIFELTPDIKEVRIIESFKKPSEQESSEEKKKSK